MRSGVCYPSYAADAVWSGGAFSADYPVTNLASLKDIRKVARATTSAAQTVTGVFPANRSIQFFAMVHHNAPLGATFRFRMFSDAAATVQIYDSGTVPVWPTDPGLILFPRIRPIYLADPVTARAVSIVLTSRAALDNVAWELGAVDIGGWWGWTDTEVSREFGLENNDTISEQPDSVNHAMAQWAPRIFAGTREAVDQSELDGNALDFIRDMGMTKPFVWNWDVDDPATWARETMLVKNTHGTPAAYDVMEVGRMSFKFKEHL